jgi:glycosyltransferase involved in cell wall biosynthesis
MELASGVLTQRGVSMIICCHNSIERVLPTLQHIAKQHASGILWELIIVDNNSIDGTGSFVLDEWPKIKNNNTPLLVVEEKQPGLKFAREAGLRAANFEFIIFCDDDNHLEPDYINKVYSHFIKDDNLGMIGGMGIAISDVPLPEWFSGLQGLFAVGRPVDKNGPLLPGVGYIYGAGMALRKSAWKNLNDLNFKSVSIDRKGKDLSGGHDVELSYAIRLIGYKVIFEDTLRFKHFIDARRLTKEYIFALTRGSSSNYISLVYFLALQRQINSSFGFVIAYLKRLVADRMYISKLRKIRDKSVGDEVALVMGETSFSFLLGNFFSALHYFIHVRHIYRSGQLDK